MTASNDTRVAVLVGCDNTTPNKPEYALHGLAEFGRAVQPEPDATPH
ncbi:MAG: hypothetical protein RL323_1514 [Pseudomonadota bacterium]|jgi:hypothetical protein